VSLKLIQVVMLRILQLNSFKGSMKVGPLYISFTTTTSTRCTTTEWALSIQMNDAPNDKVHNNTHYYYFNHGYTYDTHQILLSLLSASLQLRPLVFS